jgi:hypothetical protein
MTGILYSKIIVQAEWWKGKHTESVDEVEIHAKILISVLYEFSDYYSDALLPATHCREAG